MSKLAGAAGGPVVGAAAAAALVLVVALIIGPADDSGTPQEAPSGLIGAVPEDAAPQDTGSDTTGEQSTQAEPTEEAETQAEAASPEDAAEVPSAMPAPPSIDTFRLDPDGALLVAGQASPGWNTVVTLDGNDLEAVTPDAAGKFVAFLQIEHSTEPRILSLRMRDPAGGEEIVSRDEVIIAPTPEAAPDPMPADDEVAALDDEAEAAEPAADPGAEATTLAEPDTSANPEPAQTVLLSNEDGVRVLQPATPRDLAPEVMSSVALDAITYNEEGEVQLSGRGQGEGFVRVYLDNTPITTSRIGEGGAWRTELPQVDTGVYTLRIDETDAEGNVTSRVETPFKREDEEVISSAAAAVAKQRIAAVTVQPGSTLWAISRAAYGEGVLYVRVFEANRDRIRNPDLIYPGQVFSLPE